MARLAELLTGANAPSALARRDIATVSGILRDAGVSQVHIMRATGAVMHRGWGGSAAGLDGPGVCPWPAARAGDDAAPRTIAGRKPTAPRRHRAVGFAVFGAADPIRIHHTPTPVQSRIGFSDIQGLVSITARLGHLLGDLGVTQVSHAVSAHARAGEALLRARMAKPVPRLLLDALADLHRIAGRAARDAGLRDRSRQHYARGMSREPQTAKCCENDSAWALARLGLTRQVHAEAAAARHDSACRDLAHELATLRCAA
jgi:hypothetical protein